MAEVIELISDGELSPLEDDEEEEEEGELVQLEHPGDDHDVQLEHPGDGRDHEHHGDEQDLSDIRCFAY